MTTGFECECIVVGGCASLGSGLAIGRVLLDSGL
jgi:hypothetical protein